MKSAAQKRGSSWPRRATPNQRSAILLRPRILLVASMAIAAMMAAGCGPSYDHEVGTADSVPSAPEEAGTMAVPPSTTEAPQDIAILRVVDAYIREQTTEGSPYYIDSSATEFVGFEDGVQREDGRATCLAKFTSGRDNFFVRFVLSRETGRFVISRVVLERRNDRRVRRTLFNRDELVL